MANDETIQCDYAGCEKPFAYRIKGFNLCSEHCFEEGEFTRMVVERIKEHFATTPPEQVVTDCEKIIATSEHCQHEHLDMDGICHQCGKDCRGIG